MLHTSNSSVNELFRLSLNDLPPVTRAVLAIVVALYTLTSVSTFFFEACTLISGYTIPPHFYVWNVLLAGWCAHSLVELVFHALALLTLGRTVERTIGGSAYARLLVIANSGVGISLFVTMVVCFFLTGDERYLFTSLASVLAGTGALTVAVKQAQSEACLTFARLNVPLRLLPSLFLLGVAVITALVAPFVRLVFAGLGVVIAWTYLRFIQRQADGTRGDASPGFAFDTFFPEPMQPQVAALASRVYALAVAVRLCPPRTLTVDASGAYQVLPLSAAGSGAAGAAGAGLAMGAGAAGAGLAAGAGMAGAGGGAGAVAAHAGVGGSAEAARRRELALRLLDGRLERLNAEANAGGRGVADGKE